jgi:branched-chain amino acid transport system permease protein
MDKFLQQVVNGLSIGSVYALMAVGYSLVYSVMNFSNFAHGGVIMFGAYFGFFLMTAANLPFHYSFIGAIVLAGILAVIIERVAYRPLRERNAPFLYFIISAMGVSMFLENIVIATVGPTPRTFPRVFPMEPLSLGPVTIGWIDMFMFAVAAICLTLLIVLLDFTKIGKAVQAAAFNMKGSALMGINTGFVIMLVFLLGGLLAGAAGILFGMKYTVYPQIGLITIKSFIAAVFGGLGSVPGAVIGSVLLGIIETFTAGYISSQYRDLVSFAILILVLVVRPTGLMGKSREDKA